MHADELHDRRRWRWRVSPRYTKGNAHIDIVISSRFLYAFGVGYSATYDEVDSFVTHMIRRRNNVMSVALNRRNFPPFERICILNPAPLCDFKANINRSW